LRLRPPPSELVRRRGARRLWASGRRRARHGSEPAELFLAIPKRFSISLNQSAPLRQCGDRQADAKRPSRGSGRKGPPSPVRGSGYGSHHGPPATPSMPDDGDLLACRTNTNHFARPACGVIPCDKYNHCGGEGPFRITAQTLSGWPPSPPTESRIHLEGKTHLLSPIIRNLRLAGKRVTDFENISAL
jgi:hypothetical protein